jgi:hypothetical protein
MLILAQTILNAEPHIKYDGILLFVHGSSFPVSAFPLDYGRWTLDWFPPHFELHIRHWRDIV